jgi:hypothetical protein
VKTVSGISLTNKRFYLYTSSRAQIQLKLRVLIDFLQGKPNRR